ncbi:MAG: dynamin family protein, partial [Vicinamibacteraceae bacterium]
MTLRLLSERETALLAEERRTLAAVREALERFGASDEDRVILNRAIEQLDDFFLLVVVGEFNAGKSAFINIFIGQDVLEEGVTPTTAQITVLRHGETLAQDGPGNGIVTVHAPVELLREVHLVDTPGTNAVVPEHQTITERFVPRADLVLFLTSVDRPFTESERAFLTLIRDWGKKIIVVLNKIDILERDEEIGKVITFVEESAERLVGIKPPVFPVSLRLARRGRRDDAAAWEASRFAALEAFLRETLEDRERIRLKLSSPLGVGARLAETLRRDVQERLALLGDDLTVLEDVDRQLAMYREDMTRDFRFRIADIDNLLLAMEQRGHAFFDETLRVGRVFDLLNRSRTQEAFKREVVADTPEQIERRVSTLIDWLVDADFRQWAAVNQHLHERRRQHAERIVGGSEQFHHDRARLIDSVGRELQGVVDTYDRTREAAAIADKARDSVAAAAALQVAAAGLGAVVTIAATTAAADITGIVLA